MIAVKLMFSVKVVKPVCSVKAAMLVFSPARLHLKKQLVKVKLIVIICATLKYLIIQQCLNIVLSIAACMTI